MRGERGFVPTEQETSDEVLIERLRARDEQAWQELYQKYISYVRATAGKFVNWEAAQDVAADTFITAREHIGDVRSASRLKAWLASMARNRCLNLLRDHKRRAAILAKAAKVLPAQEPSERGPEAVAALREVSGPLWEAVSRLPEEQRDVLILCTLGGMEMQEVADHFGVPRGTIGKRIFLAKQKIRETLKTYALSESRDAV